MKTKSLLGLLLIGALAQPAFGCSSTRIGEPVPFADRLVSQLEAGLPILVGQRIYTEPYDASTRRDRRRGPNGFRRGERFAFAVEMGWNRSEQIVWIQDDRVGSTCDDDLQHFETAILLPQRKGKGLIMAGFRRLREGLDSETTMRLFEVLGGPSVTRRFDRKSLRRLRSHLHDELALLRPECDGSTESSFETAVAGSKPVDAERPESFYKGLVSLDVPARNGSWSQEHFEFSMYLQQLREGKAPFGRAAALAHDTCWKRFAFERIGGPKHSADRFEILISPRVAEWTGATHEGTPFRLPAGDQLIPETPYRVTVTLQPDSMRPTPDS